MFNLVTSLIQWALFLGVAGGLIDATIAMRNEAAKAHQMGLVSLSQLNHSLLGREQHPKPKASHLGHSTGAAGLSCCPISKIAKKTYFRLAAQPLVPAFMSVSRVILKQSPSSRS